jgi:hypothetical protein
LVGISILLKYQSPNLQQFPIINSTHHLLPSPHGELAPAIEAVLDIYGTEVTVVVSHNGQGLLRSSLRGIGTKLVIEEDPLDRELQSKELARIMAASYPRPVVFLGYVVTKPKASRRKLFLIGVNMSIKLIDDWLQLLRIKF